MNIELNKSSPGEEHAKDLRGDADRLVEAGGQRQLHVLHAARPLRQFEGTTRARIPSRSRLLAAPLLCDRWRPS